MKWIKKLALGISVLGVIGFALADDAKTTGQPDAKGDGKFKIATSGGSTFLLDQNTGATWNLMARKDGSPVWCPLTKSNTAEQLVPVPSALSEPIKNSIPPRIALAKEGYTRVKLIRTGIGILAVKATIGDTEVRLALDTGANSLSLDRQRTAHLKLKWAEEVRGPFDDPTQTGGSTIVRNLKIGKFHVEKWRALAFDLRAHNDVSVRAGVEPFDGVLGVDILDACLAVIDFKSNDLYMYVGNPEESGG
jgi:hypothetical protein